MLQHQHVMMVSSWEWPNFESSSNADILLALVGHQQGLQKLAQVTEQKFEHPHLQTEVRCQERCLKACFRFSFLYNLTLSPGLYLI